MAKIMLAYLNLFTIFTAMATRSFEYGTIIFAGVLYAFALKYFVFPAQVILTGFEGVSTALSYYFESYWLFVICYIIFQSALLFFAFSHISKVFALRSFLVVTTVTLALMILPDLQFASPEPHNERIILVLFGGILSGVAKAMAFKNRGSTGDEDVLGAYFALKYLKPVGSIAVIASIISTSFGLFLVLVKTGDFEAVINTLMYTCIYIFASVEVLNNIYKKFKITMLSVVTKSEILVGAAISSTSEHRTYTVDKVNGGRSGGEYSIVCSIITHEELPQMLKAIQESDPECFYYYHDIEGISERYYITPIG